MSSVLRTIYLFTVVGLSALFLWGLGGCSTSECKENSDCESYQVCLQGSCSGTKQADEPSREGNAEDAGGSSRLLCPARCANDKDCMFCGTKRTCDTSLKRCADARDLCPSVCNTDKDCLRSGCGAKRACNLVSGKCYERIEQCPSTCKENADCKKQGCGTRTKCSSRDNRCYDPDMANCPFSCKADTECAKDCGSRNRCQLSSPASRVGRCRALGSEECPSSCQTSRDCFVRGCKERLYCNYATNRCVTGEKLCTFNCKEDQDCSQNCGTRTFCYKASPGAGGYCRTPNNKNKCPEHCRTSYDCKVKACNKNVYCNYKTRKCVPEGQACPGRCQSNSDCPERKCGSFVRCRNGRCSK